MILALHSWPAGDREVSSLGLERAGNTKVTIYSRTDCKLYDVVHEGELLGRRRRILRGQPWIAARGLG